MGDIKKKRVRRTKAQIEADKVNKVKPVTSEVEHEALVKEVQNEIKSEPKDPNPPITFLRKDGKPVYILLHIAIDRQQMKEREYALGYKEVFADERVVEKVDGIMYKGRPAIETLKEMYSI